MPRSDTRTVIFAVAMLVPAIPLTAVAQPFVDIFSVGSAAASEGESVEVTVTIESNEGNTGYSLGVCSDPSVVEPIDLAMGPDLLTIACGSPPLIYIQSVEPGGVTSAALYENLFSCAIAPPGTYDMLVISYVVQPGAAGEVADLEFCDTLGVPPIDNVIVHDGASYFPTLENGWISVTEVFRRGDCNVDGGFDIADAISILEALFVPSSPQPMCDDACDANDDGSVDIGDAIQLLNVLFSGGAIPAPTTCGADATVDELGCAIGDGC